MIYAIGLLNEEERHEAKIAKRALDALANESGGLAFYPKAVVLKDLAELPKQVMKELKGILQQ